MIKRYGLGRKPINAGDGQSLCVPDIVEMSDGDYVRYEHHISALDLDHSDLKLIKNGRITINRSSLGFIRIEIKDADRGLTFTEIKITPHDFAMALTGLAETECELKTKGISWKKLGMK